MVREVGHALGSYRTNSEGVEMKRIVAASLMAGLIVVALPATSQAVVHSRFFQMPSHNIFCADFSGHLRCDVGTGLSPEPSKPCQLDWTGLYLDRRGKAGPVCSGDTVRKLGERVLLYGHRWRRDGMMCKSRRSGLRCRNRIGHGFLLSRERWATY